MNGFSAAFETEKLHGAPYNPRQIDADTLETLQRSIRTVGFAKPIIVTQDGMIVAGHQRTKAARAMGLFSVPAYVLDEINTYDEIRFNQLHNGTDLDKIDKPVMVPPRTELGFAEIAPDDIAGDMRAEGAGIRSEIMRLLTAYGNWGGAVCNQDGVVVSSPQYLLACKAIRMKARVYYVPNAETATAAGFFQRQYGKFSYEHLRKDTWIQTFAQPMRLRSGNEDDVYQGSVLYNMVIPTLTKDVRVLDFGCGQGDMVKALKKMGYNIRGVEFFRRAGRNLDKGAVHRMCDKVAEELERDGLYDVVVCDSVINSVDTPQAEIDVMVSLNALAKPGAPIFFSGRSREYVEDLNRKTQHSIANSRAVEFMDEHGFSGLYREGTWFYQLFHRKSDAIALGKKYLGDGPYIRSNNSWQYTAFKSVDIPEEECMASLMREFNLPWPEGQCVGRGEKIAAAWKKAIEKDRAVA